MGERISRTRRQTHRQSGSSTREANESNLSHTLAWQPLQLGQRRNAASFIDELCDSDESLDGLVAGECRINNEDAVTRQIDGLGCLESCLE